MILQAIVTLLCFLVGATDDSERLRASAPSYLTVDDAAEHLIAARIAARITGEDANTLLAIAWHESNYRAHYVQPEPAGYVGSVWHATRVSCGVMTPYPIASCPSRTLVEEYIDGAAHLHEWRARVGAHALLGYAGLAGACARGPYVVQRRGVDVDLCTFEGEMLGRARVIRGNAGS